MDIDKLRTFVNSIDLDNLSPEEKRYLEGQRIKREQWLVELNQSIAERQALVMAEIDVRQEQGRREASERHIKHLREQSLWCRTLADKLDREADELEAS